MSRPRFPPRTRTSGRQTTSWFPPTEVLHRDPVPCVMVGVGVAGRAVIALARALVATERPLLLADTDGAAAWHAALQRATRPADGTSLARSGEVAVVLVGAPCDVAVGAPAIDRVRDDCSADRVSAVSLELPGPDRAPESSTVPLLGRFRLSNRYEHAVLTTDEVLDLAARLLASGAATELVRVAVNHRSAGEFAIGAAAGWLPHGRIARLLAAYMVSELATELCPPAPARAGPELLTLIPGIPLNPRLQALLAHEATGRIRQLATTWRDQPIAGLEADDHSGRKPLERAVASWVSEVASTVRGILTRTMCDPTRFRTATLGVARAIEQIDAERGRAAEQESQLADERRADAGVVSTVDAERCAAPRGLRPWRLARRWRLTRQTRRTLRRFLSVRTDELIARYQGLALSLLRKELEAVAARLAVVADRASRAREAFTKVLRPPYPNLVAQQDPKTLEVLLRELAEPLARGAGRPAIEEAWCRAVPVLLSGTGEGPWQAILCEAAAVAARSPAATRSVGEQCRGLFPLYRPEVLVELLTNLATPRRGDGVGSPDATRVLSVERSELTSPVVIELRWQSLDAG
jgi:hypothetical protein